MLHLNATRSSLTVKCHWDKSSANAEISDRIDLQRVWLDNTYSRL